MGPPRRSQSYISPASHTSGSEPSISPLSQHSSAAIKPTGTGMTPASRYQHNLKVLRRRDPSISSIFDQFSHVCLYHHNGTKWEKQGYEGSMFLYEREAYPPYGFYILNRMGSEDHIQRLYPEDNIGVHGSYLIIRSYPEYTDRRLAAVHASRDPATLNKFSDAYTIPNLEALSPNQKGEAVTVGLWMFATDSREPLFEIFTRLHSYIKRNQPYPQEFRYGPDRPPPSIHASTTAANYLANGYSSLPVTPSGANFPTSPGPGQAQFQARHPAQATANGSLSDLDKLFAKMEPTPLLSAAQSMTPTQYPTSSSTVSVHSLLASLGDGKRQSEPALSPPPANMNTGISLLDSIFASASISNVGPSPSAPPIQAPAPTTTSPAQVLDQSIISSLLGLPPSRAPSVASTAYSTDARSSHSSSREGDNEDGDTSDWRGATSDGYSESSTVLDPDAEYDEELQAAGASAGRPLLAEPPVNGRGLGYGRNGRGRVHGDVTPRPPMNGFITPTFGRQHRQSSVSVLDPSSVAERRQQSHHPQQHNNHQQHHLERTPRPPLGSERPLVPFEPDSELWPYRNQNSNVNTTSATTTNNNDNNNINNDSALSDDEILELDFADTSALSDPDAFRARHRTNGLALAYTNGTAHGNGAEKPEKRIRTKRKQNRKDRAAEHERERQEIEQTWEMPATIGSSDAVYNPPSPVFSSECDLSSDPQATRNGIAGLRKEGEKSLLDSTNATPVKEGKAKAKMNDASQSSNGARVTRESDPNDLAIKGAVKRRKDRMGEEIKDTLVNAVLAKEKAPAKAKGVVLERNDFVREVLTLIHTDKAFVDSLYKEYTGRIG